MSRSSVICNVCLPRSRQYVRSSSIRCSAACLSSSHCCVISSSRLTPRNSASCIGSDAGWLALSPLAGMPSRIASATSMSVRPFSSSSTEISPASILLFRVGRLMSHCAANCILESFVMLPPSLSRFRHGRTIERSNWEKIPNIWNIASPAGDAVSSAC